MFLIKTFHAKKELELRWRMKLANEVKNFPLLNEKCFHLIFLFKNKVYVKKIKAEKVELISFPLQSLAGFQHSSKSLEAN